MASKFSIPEFGLGTWKIPKTSTASVVYETIKLGIRHIDCACDYGNEVEVGLGIKQAITEGIVKREDLFITSKLWNTYHSPEHVLPAAKRSLNDLDIAYFDLYLIHFPIALKFVPFETRYPPEWIHDPTSPNPRMEVEFTPYSSTWRAMEDLHRAGLTHHIGVSNVNVQHLAEIWSYSQIKPVCNQVEVHPYLVQSELLEFCKTLGVKVVAFSPLGSSSYIELGAVVAPGDSVLEQPLISKIAQAHKKSPAQIILRWGVQRGCSVITKSSKMERIAEGKGILNFELTSEEMAAITGLNRNQRFNDPGVFCRGMGFAYPIYN